MTFTGLILYRLTHDYEFRRRIDPSIRESHLLSVPWNMEAAELQISQFGLPDVGPYGHTITLSSTRDQLADDIRAHRILSGMDPSPSPMAYRLSGIDSFSILIWKCNMTEPNLYEDTLFRFWSRVNYDVAVVVGDEKFVTRLGYGPIRRLLTHTFTFPASNYGYAVVALWNDKNINFGWEDVNRRGKKFILTRRNYAESLDLRSIARQRFGIEPAGYDADRSNSD